MVTMKFHSARNDPLAKLIPALSPTFAHRFYSLDCAGATNATLDWKSGDLMAVPNWNAFQLNASQDSILIRMSDAPLMQFLAWDRTSRGFEA